MVIGEVVAREGAIAAPGFVEDRDVRLDAVLTADRTDLMMQSLTGWPPPPIRAAAITSNQTSSTESGKTGSPLKPQCCPNAPARKIPRSIHEGARDMAREIASTEAYRTWRCQRKKVEMLFRRV